MCPVKYALLYESIKVQIGGNLKIGKSFIHRVRKYSFVRVDRGQNT